MDKRLENCPEHVAIAFLNLPDTIIDELLELRTLIVATHSKITNVGELIEDLRWGQPSYLTAKPVTGSTIRLGVGKCGRPAVFCHCQSHLIDTFRSQYEPVFEFEGNRALILTSTVKASKAELAHCIEQALTYKLKQAA